MSLAALAQLPPVVDVRIVTAAPPAELDRLRVFVAITIHEDARGRRVHRWHRYRDIEGVWREARSSGAAAPGPIAEQLDAALLAHLAAQESR